MFEVLCFVSPGTGATFRDPGASSGLGPHDSDGSATRTMFDNLRHAFREAVDNFNKELNRDDVPDVVDGLLTQMHEEVTDAKAQVFTLEEQIKKAIQLSDMEEKEASTCRRREEMARKIGDEETATVAAEFAEKHEKRREIQATEGPGPQGGVGAEAGRGRRHDGPTQGGQDEAGVFDRHLGAGGGPKRPRGCVRPL